MDKTYAVKNVRLNRDRRTKSENADMRAETQKVDFDPLILMQVSQPIRFATSISHHF